MERPVQKKILKIILKKDIKGHEHAPTCCENCLDSSEPSKTNGTDETSKTSKTKVSIFKCQKVALPMSIPH